MSGASSVSFYRIPVISCSMSGRTFPFTIFLVTGKRPLLFLRTSFVGSITLSMTYSINVRPYNDPYIKIVEEAMAAIAEVMIPGAFLVDIIPILKYVPEWFPGAKFQSKAAAMRKHAAKMRNTTFAATEDLMVCVSSLFLGFSLDDTYVLRPVVTMIPLSSQRHLKRSNIPTLLTKTLICWKMLPSRRIWVIPSIYIPFPTLFG